MKNSDRILHWAPRVLGIVLAAFISIFALDVFGEGYGFWGTLLALIMHLVPTFLIVGALLAGWRWEWPGGVLFIGLGSILYGHVTGQEMDFVTYLLLIPGPLAFVGVLFLMNWFQEAKYWKKSSNRVKQVSLLL